MLTKLRELGPSIVRTVTPYVVGALVTLAGKAGFDWTPSPEEQVLVTGAVGAVFYAIVRILETRGSQAWGWALGLPKAPTYDATDKVDPGSPTGQSAAVASDLPEDTPTISSRVHDGSGLPLGNIRTDVMDADAVVVKDETPPPPPPPPVVTPNGWSDGI